MTVLSAVRAISVLLAATMVLGDDYKDGTYDLRQFSGDSKCYGDPVKEYTAQLNDCNPIEDTIPQAYEIITCDGDNFEYKRYSLSNCSTTPTFKVSEVVNFCVYATEDDWSITVTCKSAAASVFQAFFIAPAVVTLVFLRFSL
ncbi:hypothetical protein CYMTET_18727 [Cymbomonas tetramitiformis]|uniref:Uncharacterized protein n=1 Tax=Cymbomonas tetramitiformis TaxID=36881 RepID=A0AAE0L5W9_9CHLO|nr:hypothetical protein CYMTET_18727 [Cymbomonas tetramitiformis]